MVCIKLLVCNESGDARLSLQELREWKKMLRAQGFGFEQGPSQYPANHEQLKMSHPSIYNLSYDPQCAVMSQG